MGRQVEAQLDDLALVVGCDVWVEYVPESDGEERVVRRYAKVHFGDGTTIASAHGDALVFDCRNRNSHNFWVLEKLIDLGVPFRWS